MIQQRSSNHPKIWATLVFAVDDPMKSMEWLKKLKTEANQRKIGEYKGVNVYAAGSIFH